MSHFAVVVTVKLKPGMGAKFKPHILKNAAAAKREEPDCHRFDVLLAEDSSDLYYFYEEYTDAAAFETHRSMPHYKAFRQATDEMVLERKVQRCAVIG